MDLSHLTKCRQYDWSAFGLKVGRDECKLLAAGIGIVGRHLDLAEDSHRTNPTCLQRVVIYSAVGCPPASEEHISSLLEPRCLRSVDPVKIARTELHPPMKNIDVVAER